MKKLSLPLILLISLAIGVFFRSFEFRSRFMYTHDNDLASWIVRDIVFDRHLRLVGQLTSAPGIFIGPLFYYAIIPFYWLTQWDPIGSVWFSVFIGIFAITSIYFVVNRIAGRIPAAFSALIYAASYGIVINEREVVPTTPVMVWTIWFLYSLYLLIKGKRAGLLLTAILFALVWHLNLALALLFPLVFIVASINYRRFTFRDLVVSASLLVFLSLPLLIFESRHHFGQLRSLASTLSSLGKHSGGQGFTDKVLHVVSYAIRNATVIFYWDHPVNFSRYLIPVSLLLVILFLGIIRFIPRWLPPIFVGWIILFIIFFTAHPINLSEYYLNGLNIIWVICAALLLSYLYKNRFSRPLSLLILTVFLAYNLKVLVTVPVNHSGYVEKKQVAEFITKDAAEHGYPCVSVSYITDPGYNMGYRYFFWLKNLHVNQPVSGSPVYSIVFPHSRVNRLDHTFGALGVIVPDYARYSPEGIQTSCSGDNSNLTDPMFGFTK